MSLLKQFSKIFSANMLQIPIGIISNIIVIRFLGAEDRGLYVLMVTIATLASTIGTFSIPTASLYYQKKSILNLNQLFVIFFFNVLIFTSLIVILSIFFKQLFFDLIGINLISNFYLFLIINIISLNMLLAFFHTMFLGNGLAREFSIVIVINAVIYFLTVILFVLVNNLNSLTATICLLISNLISLLTSIYLFKGKGIFNFKISSKSELKNLFIYSIKRYPSSLFPIFINQLPNIFLGTILGIKALGIYSVALTAFNGINALPRSINTFLLGEVAERNLQESIELVIRSSRILIFIITIIVILLSILSFYFIPLIFGDEFEESIYPAIILMSSVIFVSSIASLESFFLSNNSPGYVTIVNFFGAILIFLFAIPMINSFGLMGLPVIILFSRFLVWITYLISFMKHAKISISEVIFLRFSDIKIFLKLFKGNH